MHIHKNGTRLLSMFLSLLLLLSLIPAKVSFAEETVNTVVFNLEEAREKVDAKFVTLLFDKNDDINVVELTENYTVFTKEWGSYSIILEKYNSEKYTFLGWRVNDGETLFSTEPLTIGSSKKYGEQTLDFPSCKDAEEFVKSCSSIAQIYIDYGDTVVFDQSYIVTPVFIEKLTGNHVLEVNATEGGTTSYTQMTGDTYTLSAHANDTHVFVGWRKNKEAGYDSTDSDVTVDLTEDTIYTAVFEKKYVAITLEDNFAILKADRMDNFLVYTNENTPATVGQRAQFVIPYTLSGNAQFTNQYTFKVFKGTDTTGELLGQYSNETIMTPSTSIKKAVISIDPLPALTDVTVVAQVNDEPPVEKIYTVSLAPTADKQLQYLNTPETHYLSDNVVEDKGPDILDMVSFTDEETGQLSVYAAAIGGVLQLTGDRFDYIPGLEFKSNGYAEYAARAMAIGGTKDKLVTFVKAGSTYESTELEKFALYEYTPQRAKWTKIENSELLNVPSYSSTPLIIDDKNVWTQKAYWDGRKWTNHNYQFLEFLKIGPQQFYAVSTSNDENIRGLYEYKNNTWVKLSSITLNNNPRLLNVSLDGTAIYKTSDDYMALDLEQNVQPIPNTEKLFSRLSKLFINIDRHGDIYAFVPTRVYLMNGSIQEGRSIYKLNRETGEWVLQNVPAFNDSNEYAIGTQDYFDKKVRPTSVEKIYNLSDKISIYAGTGGAVYADFDQTTITFNSNGGSQVAPITANINSTENAPTEPTKENQHFGGWYLDKELTKAYEFDYMPAENIELFAKWVDKPVDLTQAKATANKTIEEAYKKYNKRDYDDEGWSALTKAKVDGLQAVTEATGSEDAVKTATNQTLEAMRNIPLSKNITVAVSMEKFTLGQGYIIEPTLVTVPRNTKASKIITDLLVKKYGEDPLPYKMTGNVETDFYLSDILDDGYKSEYKVPSYITDAIKADGKTIDLENDEWLGEFDFFENSGWMYAINNNFPGVGAAGWSMENDQVMRWQYTIYGLGADLNANNKQWGGSTFVSTAQKDDLTWRVAEINSMSTEDKKAFLETGDNQKHFDKAYELLTNMLSTQNDVDAALKALGGTERVGEVVEVTMPEEAKVINDAIKALPASIKLVDKAVVEKIRKDYDALNPTIKQWIWKDEISILEAAETKISQLEAEAKKVLDQIAALPSKEKMELTDETALKEAQTAYAALSKEQKALVTNAAVLTELTLKLTELKAEAATKEANVKAAQAVIDQIAALPSAEKLKLTDEAALKEVQTAYVALSKVQKALVINAVILTELTTKLAELKNDGTKAAKEVMDLITNLPNVSSLKLSHESILLTVKTAYDDLSAEQKKMVTNSSKLTILVATMTELKEEAKDKESALKVTNYINSLPSIASITLADKKNVTYARTQYNALTTKQKSFVLNLSKLIDAEAKIAELEVDVKVLINEINILPSVSNITLKHETMIQMLRAAYNKLSNAQKLEVTNYSKLVEAEEQVAKLKAEETKNVPEDLVNAVKTSSGIEAIKENTKTNILEITSKGKAAEIEISFSKGLIQAIKAKDVETVVINSTEDVSLEIPKVIFVEAVSKNNGLTVQTETLKQGNRIALQVNITETLTNGIKRDITLPQAYVKITLPLSTFSSAGNASNGVILRVVEGEYKAVPHQIKNGEVFIYANANDQYVHTTETVTFEDIASLGNKEDVEFLAERRIVNGTTSATYAPYKSITRAEFGVMIARALNLVATEESTHKDTKGTWYEDEIQALYEAGITNVTGNFNPHATLTREQAAAFMYRVIQYIEKDTNSTSTKVSYKDNANISPHFIEAIASLQDLSIMEGKLDGNFDPKGNLTRAQMAKILKRTLQEVNMM